MTPAEYQREIERRDELLRGADEDLKEARAEVVALRARHDALIQDCEALEVAHEGLCLEHANCDDARDEAINLETEACARVCEQMPHFNGNGNRVDHADYAAAIRARGGR